MSYNTASGQNADELLERAVTALVREWGVSEDEARAAIERAKRQEQRLGREIARERTWQHDPDTHAGTTGPAAA